MNTEQFTEYNKKTLININEHLKNSGDFINLPVKKSIHYEDFTSLGIDLMIILNAIECIGYKGENKNLILCAELASIAQKLIPTNELLFLDSLLIKEENSKEVFSKIADL
ncbi:hypothetical protein [Flavobacterium davisii]|uniref:Uncharacterized protein n=1 Tax=Flavobacterium columnare TaxID=996 RepID=A0A8G0P5G9_9FLAO|nr:hypothetical protein [Flavobacterium davisii]QYS88022.1 hypothetical protein JJC05_09080 [Flavobacterium davisii]